VEAVKSTVKKEIRTFSDVVKEGSKNSVTKETLDQAVKSAVSEDQRYRKLVIFGFNEKNSENLEQCVIQEIKN
jgi:hypothetical protein